MQRLKIILSFICLTIPSCLLSWGALPIGDYLYTILSDEKLEARICGPADGVELTGDIVLPSKVIRPSNGLEYTIVEIGTADGNIRDEKTGKEPFSNLTKITSVTIPETITYIWDEAFTGCTNIKKFIVKLANHAYKSVDGVLYQKDEDGMAGDLIRFPPASELTSFKLGDRTVFQSARGIRYGAFRDNKNLKTLILGKRTYLSYGPFVGNLGIQKFEKGNSDLNVQNGLILTDDGETLLATPPAYTTGKFTVPPSVKTIYMYGCASLRASSVEFNNVQTIERQAFIGAALKEVTIPETVTSFETALFYECHNLTTATIKTKIKALPAYTFAYCNNLTTVNLSSSCKALYGSVFKGCKAMKEFSMANYTSMDDGVHVCDEQFAESGIVKVNWPSKVTTIPAGCYFKCTDLVSISLKETTEVIDDLAFYGTSLESFNSGNLKEIRSYAFENCMKLKKIVLPESSHTVSLGTETFPINEDANIFIDHKDIDYVGWAGEDWSDSFYGYDKGVVFTSHIQPKVFIENWNSLYCPWGEKENYQRLNYWGTVREMFAMSRNPDNTIKVTPNYEWVKIIDVTESPKKGIDINFTAKDVKMHCIYPTDYPVDIPSSVSEITEPVDIVTYVSGTTLHLETTKETECQLVDVNGMLIYFGLISGSIEIPLPSAGLYLLTARQGISATHLKLLSH